MAYGEYFADIHLHPTIKAFNSGRPYPRRNLWDRYEHHIGKSNPAKFAVSNTKDLAKYSQANLYALAEGKVRVATASLYPMEKGFTHIRNIPNLIVNRNAQAEMIEIISGMTADSVKYSRDVSKSYFYDLQEEYKFLMAHQGKSPNGKYAYKVVNNYSELKELLGKDETTLAILVAVEGSHALFDEEMLSGKLNHSHLKKKLEENIGILKSWEAPPFTMNLCHHFDNGLSGHSRSFMGAAAQLLNQNKNIDKGLNGLGIKVLKEYASRQNGKRIIVDVKHMSIVARREYFNWVRSYNYISTCDKLPVISSHSCVNGFPTMIGSTREKDVAAKYNKKHFNSFSLHQSDEEIRIIHASTGLIGLMLDKHKLGGGLFFKNFIDNEDDPDKRHEAYLRKFFDNVFQIVKAVGNETGWNCIALGSDLDGGIEHVDAYDTCATYPQLYKDLVEFLERTKYAKTLWYHYTPEQIVDKIMRKNTMDFYERHFV